MDNLALDRNVTQVLRTLMAATGRTQTDVATALGITQSSVSNKMAGKTAWSLRDIATLAVFFNLRDEEGRPSAGRFLEDPRRLLVGSLEDKCTYLSEVDGAIPLAAMDVETMIVDVRDPASALPLVA